MSVVCVLELTAPNYWQKADERNMENKKNAIYTADNSVSISDNNTSALLCSQPPNKNNTSLFSTRHSRSTRWRQTQNTVQTPSSKTTLADVRSRAKNTKKNDRGAYRKAIFTTVLSATSARHQSAKQDVPNKRAVGKWE